MMTKLLLIAGGGAVGAMLRFGVTEIVKALAGQRFAELGTLLVNILGCLLIGFIGGALARQSESHEGFRMLIVVGLLGAFTTFSTFGWEAFAQWKTAPLVSIAYVLANNALGIAAVVGGYRLGMALLSSAASAP